MNEDDYEYASDVYCDKCFSSNFDCVNCTTEPLKAVIAELLAACEAAIGRLDRLDDDGTGEHSPAYLQIQEAIAKAKGKQ